MIYKFNDFVLDDEFNLIVNDIFRLIESEGRWIDKNKYEWDFSIEKDPNTLVKDSMLEKLRKFVEKLPAEKIKHYYVKLMNSIKNLPDQLRKNLIIGITGVFMLFTSLDLLTEPIQPLQGAKHVRTQVKAPELSTEQTIEIVNLHKKSSFKDAQKLVSSVEKGYSGDRGDSGNWFTNKHGKKIFIGTNHGISAPVLATYLHRTPTRDDMLNLSYATAVKIYKINYWNKQHLNYFCNQSIANLIYDGCVNQGVEGMKGVFKKALTENNLSIEEDVFSVKTIKKANSLNQLKLFNSIKKYRAERYKNAPTFKRHGEGWMNRLDSLEFRQ